MASGNRLDPRLLPYYGYDDDENTPSLDEIEMKINQINNGDL